MTSRRVTTTQVTHGCRTFAPDTERLPADSSPTDVSPVHFCQHGTFRPILLSVSQCELPTAWKKKADPPSFFAAYVATVTSIYTVSQKRQTPLLGQYLQRYGQEYSVSLFWLTV